MKSNTTKVITLGLLAALFCTPVFGDMHKASKEAQRKAKTFLNFDKDGDKLLNQEEYTTMTKTWFEKNGKEGYEKAAKQRFKNKDTDGDGFVSFKEQFGMDLPE